MKFLFSIILFCVTFHLSYGQETYISTGAQVWNFGNVGVFGNITNEGSLGSSPNANLYFYGKVWTNGFNASLRDESTSGLKGTGGFFSFAGSSGQQTISGGFNVAAKIGASFPNVNINNPDGVIFYNLNDLKIRNTLSLSNGLIFLNGQNLMVGDTSAGSIIGYSDRRFVVTGTTSTGGFLYRSKLNSSAGQVVFPIGSSALNYAPAAVQYEGDAEDFHARVFDSVYQYASSGTSIYDTVVYKTWNIGEELGGTGKTAVTLQHMDSNEGDEYSLNRDESYISLFKDSEWEHRYSVNDNMSTGTLTSQAMASSATMHSRGFGGIGLNAYFAKKTNFSNSYTPATIIDFNAYRVSISLVDLVWITSRETNMNVFEVERRLDNEETFTKVGTVATKAPNGNSTTKLSYYYQDTNAYDGWSYYRIKAVSKTGKYVYSDVREVGPLVAVTVYPNPNWGDFKINVRGIKTTLVMQLYDVWGQVMRRQEITGAGDVEVHNLPAGTYFLVMKQKDTMKEVYTCKVIVIDH
ncbi:T9SS type A sorting domain-containing protein [Chitinophaga sancti]|uniref:T9SS type A sorting domain-containing protein n=1 Tax=Chitinophaga sancti TaxID=1004 RepID=UPI002A74FFF7|nr:T9SS type A sorting domain-containing protein [Chitinophaga sancti]WPQ62522.1 T9SS type A sorting domain-containing protein [Chitinophaga sancti]